MLYNYSTFSDLFMESTRNGLTKPRAIRGNGFKMVNMGELFAHSRIGSIEMDRVPLSQNEKNVALLKKGDLLFARQSLVLEGAGKCSIFLGDEEPVTFESHITRVRLDQTKANPLFYYYYFLSPHGRSAILRIVEQGAGAAGIRGSELSNVEVIYPSLSDQDNIAKLLSLLDDAIELKHRMNHTLESIAQTLFQSWFVDFDPAKAKAEGRKPEGMDEETALLFPDSFEDSTLGKIPKGWKLGKVSDVSEVTDFVANGSFESLRNNVKYTSDPDYAILVRLVDFNHGWKGDYVYLAESAYAFLKKSALEPDDVVIANVGANAGTVFKVPNLGKPMTLGPNAIVVKPLEAIGINKQYIYYLFSSPEGQQQLQSILSGSAQPKFNKTDMRALRVAIPSRESLNLFKQLTQAFWDRQRAIHSETETLTKIRDTLLPRLISGKLRVGDVSKTVEALAL